MIILEKCLDKDQPQIDAFTQHPEVCGEHKVGCQNVESAAPELIQRPDRDVIEDQLVRDQPE